MISTDGVKQSADDLGILDSNSIVNELNVQQSQKFTDPNCNPGPVSTLNVIDDSFCDTPLDGRSKRLDDFLKNLPLSPVLPDQSTCAQATLTKIQDMITQKFSFANFEEDMKKSKFEEEKVEAQLNIVLFAAQFIKSLAQVTRKTPLLTTHAVNQLNSTIAAINNLSSDDRILNFEKQNAIDKLTDALTRLNNISIDQTVYNLKQIWAPQFPVYQRSIILKFTEEIMISQVNNFCTLRENVSYTSRRSTGAFGEVYTNASNKIINSQNPTVDGYNNDIISGKKTVLDATWSDIINTADRGIIKQFAFVYKSTPDMTAAGIGYDTSIFITNACTKLVVLFNSYFNQTSKPPTERDVFAELGKLDLCGEKLPDVAPTIDHAPDSDNSADLGHNTFDVNNTPTITELKYWKRYSVYLTLMNLLPVYWTIGLYIPSPSGIIKVPLPTIWRPLFVFDAKPYGLIVIFLTINGIAISPTVWVMKYPPFGKNESNLAIMLRAFNKKIKDNTGDALLNVPVVNGINVNPALTKTLPFKQDDLPTIKRLGMNNPPYVLYLTQWLQQYKTGGGLP